MEPSRSLDAQIFSRLDKIVYRNLTESLNPLEIPEINYIDPSPPIDIIVSQDCGGFNLGSFLICRSGFTCRAMDLWWDPIFYEQK
jgi:mannan polymerase II complex MNN10 subunit